MTWICAGGVSAFLDVALGAFGAHGLRGRIAPDMMAVFETAVRWHLAQGIALVAHGAAAPRLPPRAVRGVGALFAAGTVLFAGSLYALALTGARWLGAITPVGGLAFLAGWAWLAWAAWSARGTSGGAARGADPGPRG